MGQALIGAILAGIILAALLAIAFAVAVGNDPVPDTIRAASDEAIARQLTTTLNLPEG